MRIPRHSSHNSALKEDVSTSVLIDPQITTDHTASRLLYSMLCNGTPGVLVWMERQSMAGHQENGDDEVSPHEENTRYHGIGSRKLEIIQR